MSILDETNRRQVWAAAMEQWSSDREVVGACSKADLRVAVDALDEFLEDSKVAIDNAIPQPARDELSPNQKARLLVFVSEQRFRTGS